MSKLWILAILLTHTTVLAQYGSAQYGQAQYGQAQFGPAQVPYSSQNNINTPYLPTFGSGALYSPGMGGASMATGGSYPGMGGYSLRQGTAQGTAHGTAGLATLLFNDFMLGDSSFTSRLMRFGFLLGLGKMLEKRHAGASQLIMMSLLMNRGSSTSGSSLAQQPRGLQDSANPCLQNQLSGPTQATSGYNQMLQGLLFNAL